MTATTSKLGEDMNDSEMNTLVIQTATAAGLRVNVDGKMLNDNYTNVMGSFPSLVRFARALLARQPAAIGKEAVFGWVQDNPGAPDKPHFILNPSGPGMTHDRVALYAAPLANEANKPAPSVEQDESPRAATVNLYICENCDAVWKRNYLHLPEGCSADDWMAVPKKRGSQSLSTLIQVASLACIENRLLDDEDRRELAEYADVIRNSPQIEARAASTSANVAQGAEPSAYRTLLDSLGYPWLPCPICNGTEGCDHSYPERARAALAAPPTQTALTDDARECLMDVVSHHHDFRTACIEIKAANETTRSDELYWQKQIDVLDRMKAQAERALTTAQSASASEGK